MNYRKMAISFRCVFALVLTLLPLTAAAETWRCRLDEVAANNGFIPTQIAVRVDQGAGTAAVYDRIIREAVGENWLAADLVAASARGVTVAWKVETMTNRNRRVEISYRLNIQRADGRTFVTAKRRGCAGCEFRATGTCRTED